jgi:hypothetical protein
MSSERHAPRAVKAIGFVAAWYDGKTAAARGMGMPRTVMHRWTARHRSRWGRALTLRRSRAARMPP